MARLVDAAQIVDVDVRVDLRGGQVGVAEQLLHDAKVRSACEKMRGKAVPQRVRGYMLLDARGDRVRADEPPHRCSVQRPPRSGKKKSRGQAIAR